MIALLALGLGLAAAEPPAGHEAWLCHRLAGLTVGLYDPPVARSFIDRGEVVVQASPSLGLGCTRWVGRRVGWVTAVELAPLYQAPALRPARRMRLWASVATGPVHRLGDALAWGPVAVGSWGRLGGGLRGTFTPFDRGTGVDVRLAGLWGGAPEVQLTVSVILSADRWGRR